MRRLSSHSTVILPFTARISPTPLVLTALAQWFSSQRWLRSIDPICPPGGGGMGVCVCGAAGPTSAVRTVPAAVPDRTDGPDQSAQPVLPDASEPEVCISGTRSWGPVTSASTPVTSASAPVTSASGGRAWAAGGRAV